MPDEHIGVVTGLSDLANFLAAVRIGNPDAVEDGSVRIVLFGGAISLPQGLIEEFRQIVNDGFPQCEFAGCVFAEGAAGRAHAYPDLRRRARKRIVYGNAIHKIFHLDFYAFLEPDEFIFFDNGLSTYWRHAADVAADFAARSLPFPRVAVLSLSPPLPLPAYLSAIPIRELTESDYRWPHDRLRAASRVRPRGAGIGPNLVLGTSLFRTKLIDWDEERKSYLDIIFQLREMNAGRILFKPHPRSADRPLITDKDGVELFDTSAPIEAFAGADAGRAFGISSTALFTLEKFHGWRSYRLHSQAIQKVVDKVPHLALSGLIAPAPPMRN